MPGFDAMTGLRLLGTGVVVGFSIAAPVGPIGLLCIRRSLAGGLRDGLLTGLGAASADALYGALAGLGFTAVAGWLVHQRTVLSVLGGAYLCFLGLRSLRQPVATAAPAPPTQLSLYGSTFLLTLTNPMTILSFVALFAGLGISAGGNVVHALLFVAGVFAGSALWWLSLSGTVTFLRHQLPDRFIRIINRVAGAIVLGFGVYAVAAGLRG
jgi:threonine/homoserine/homoserine lactone efflux protein